MVVRQACMHECSVAKSHVTLCDPKDCSPRGSSVRGISQARILEWVAFFFCRGFSQPRVSCITGGLFIPEPPVKPTSRCVCICKNKSIYTLKMSVLYYKLHTPSSCQFSNLVLPVSSNSLPISPLTFPSGCRFQNTLP